MFNLKVLSGPKPRLERIRVDVPHLGLAVVGGGGVGSLFLCLTWRVMILISVNITVILARSIRFTVSIFRLPPPTHPVGPDPCEVPILGVEQARQPRNILLGSWWGRGGGGRVLQTIDTQLAILPDPNPHRLWLW